jgi:ketosteroid isomerase-like protein
MAATLSLLVASHSGPATDTRRTTRDAALQVSWGNAAVVRSMCAAYGRLAQNGEIASFVAEYFDPDCEYQPVEETDKIRGHHALIRWTQRWLEAWDETWDEVDQAVEAGEMVVAAIRVHGRGRGSGMEISQRLFYVFELRLGKIVRMRDYLDPDQALEAAGLV